MEVGTFDVLPGLGYNLGMSALLCLLLAAPSQESQTVRYKDLGEIVDGIAAEVRKSGKSSVTWLVDNATMLKASRHGELLGGAVRRSFEGVEATHLVVAFGARPRSLLRAPADADLAAGAIEGLADGQPDDSIKNCLSAIRETAQAMSRLKGAKRHLVLFTQENGDSEDNLEATLKILERAKISFHAVTPEAVYSDPYWESALSGVTYFFDVSQLKKLSFQLKGPESAFLEFPYGWPFAQVDPAYTVPSGFGPYALNRLASRTGGKSYLYSVDRSPSGFCQRYGCQLCMGKHKACGAAFDGTKVGVTAPEIGSRPEYAKRYGKERLFLANLNVWKRLYEKKIIRGAPPLRASGTRLSEYRRKGKPEPLAFTGTEWKALRQRALAAVKEVGTAAAELLKAEERFGKKADRRVLATTDALVVHLAMLDRTFTELARFCEAMGRAGRPGPSDGFSSSALDPVPGRRVIAFTTRNYSLCHGGAPLKDVRFLGDSKPLHEALDLADRMIEKHRGTPWEVLMRRAYLTVFLPVLEQPRVGTGQVQPTPRTRAASGANTQATPGGAVRRPARPVRGGTQGGGTGTRTGR